MEITRLEKNEIFVFGSNLAGLHGRGAAKTAHRKFGAIMGCGEGLQGQSYGIPTKDEKLKTLCLVQIAINVTRFLRFAESLPDLRFLVTTIGCGLAGYKSSQIAPMFTNAPVNVVLPPEFTEIQSQARVHTSREP